MCGHSSDADSSETEKRGYHPGPRYKNGHSAHKGDPFLEPGPVSGNWDPKLVDLHARAIPSIVPELLLQIGVREVISTSGGGSNRQQRPTSA